LKRIGEGMNIRDDIKRAIEACKFINYSKEIVKQADLEEIMNVERLKSVGYTVSPIAVKSNGFVLYNIEFFVIDVSNNDDSVLSGTMESSVDAIQQIYKAMELKVGDLQIETMLEADEEMDLITVILKGTVNGYTG
jgi:hypothetical protein